MHPIAGVRRRLEAMIVGRRPFSGVRRLRVSEPPMTRSDFLGGLK